MMTLRPGTITNLRAAFEMHETSICTRQSIMKAQHLRKGWALTPGMNDHILKMRLQEEDSMARIMEACDAIGINEVLHCINTETGIDWF